MITDPQTEDMPLAQVVVSNVRAELARRHMPPGVLMDALGLSESSIYRRFSEKDPIPFHLDQIDAAARFLGVSTDRLTSRTA